MSVSIEAKAEIDAAIDRLVEQYRSMCLWFAPRGYYPSTDEERLKTLAEIERYGDRQAFVRARELRHWLSQLSRNPSSAS